MKVGDVDKVVIRVWQDSKEESVFALFPEIPADSSGFFCSFYQHVGQHGIADYGHCIKNSRPATEKEAAPLLKELKVIGYNPLVIKRVNPQIHHARVKSIRELTT